MSLCRNCQRPETDHVKGHCPTNTMFKARVGQLGMRVHNEDGSHRDVSGTDLKIMAELREMLRDNDLVRVTFKRL